MKTFEKSFKIVDMDAEDADESKPWWTHWVTPLTIGAYAVAGVYIGRALKNSTDSLPLNKVLMVAATSTAAAAIAAKALPHVFEKEADSAPLVEAALSTAITWAAINAEMGRESATMFAPIQFIAHFTGDIAGEMVKKNLEGMAEESD
jgi:hypothetical protein